MWFFFVADESCWGWGKKRHHRETGDLKCAVKLGETWEAANLVVYSLKTQLYKRCSLCNVTLQKEHRYQNNIENFLHGKNIENCNFKVIGFCNLQSNFWNKRKVKFNCNFTHWMGFGNSGRLISGWQSINGTHTHKHTHRYRHASLKSRCYLIRGLEHPKAQVSHWLWTKSKTENEGLKMCRFKNNSVFFKVLQVHGFPERQRVRVNVHTLLHPVSPPSCALLGLILWVHPDRLTDAPVDCTSASEHRQHSWSVQFRTRGCNKNTLAAGSLWSAHYDDEGVGKSWGILHGMLHNNISSLLSNHVLALHR